MDVEDLMRTALRRRGHARRHGERGAVAVEAALVTVFLVVPLVLGLIEFAFVMRDYVAVTSATRSGARIASASTNIVAGQQVCDVGETGTQCSNAAPPELAKVAANAIQLQGSALNKDQIKYLLVYKANATGYPGALAKFGSDPRSDCLGSGGCVVYTWVKSTYKFTYSAGAWTASTINACVSNADSVGVYLRSVHPFITKLFGSSMAISDRTVMRFEPLTANICKSGTR
jgi:hypothetical protein